MYGKLAEIIDANPDLSSSEKLQLKDQLKAATSQDLDPQEEVTLFRRIKGKLAQPAWNLMVPILQNVLTEYAKKQLGL